MPQPEKLYQSILSRLSMLAADQLEEVDAYLRRLTEVKPAPPDNRTATMKLAGSWSDMSDEDFDAYLKAAKSAQIIPRDFDV